MKRKLFRPGQLVRVKKESAPYGGKQGRVINTGYRLGWPVVRIELPDVPEIIPFSPDELIAL